MKVELTGNPFVDTGLAVIAHLAGLHDIRELTLMDLKKVFGDGKQLANRNSITKSFTMIFTNNSLLKNPSIEPESKRKEAYRAVLSALLNEINQPDSGIYCQSCGDIKAVDFPKLTLKALDGILGKNEPRFIGRDWFPLTGTLSEAQSLPSAATTVQLCAKCLFSVHFLPLGVMLHDGKLACFQSTDVDWWYEQVRFLASQIIERIDAGDSEIFGKGMGKTAAIMELVKLMDQLKQSEDNWELPSDMTLYLWLFSNSGTGAECGIIPIPNKELVFLWKAITNGYRQDVEYVLNRDSKGLFLSSISDSDDFWGLYSDKKNPGVSFPFYLYYQFFARGRNLLSLKKLYHMMHDWFESEQQTNEKGLERLRLRDAFFQRENLSLFNRKVAESVAKRQFTLLDFWSFYQSENQGRYTLDRRMLHFFASKLPDHHWPDTFFEDYEKDFNQNVYFRPTTFLFYANQLTESLTSQELERLAADCKNYKVGLTRLQSLFIDNSKESDFFTYAHWELFLYGENGLYYPTDSLFWMRLYLFDKLNGYCFSVVPSPTLMGNDGLDDAMSELVEHAVYNFINKKGLEHFVQLLSDFRHRKQGLYPIRSFLASYGPLSEDQNMFELIWEEFLIDVNGFTNDILRRFQLLLAMSNILRGTKNKIREEIVNE